MGKVGFVLSLCQGRTVVKMGLGRTDVERANEVEKMSMDLHLFFVNKRAVVFWLIKDPFYVNAHKTSLCACYNLASDNMHL